MTGAWIDALVRLQADATAAVVVGIVGTRGSVPRAAGTHMVVTRDAVHGTIGGGHLEFQAIGIARGMLDGTRDGERLRRFPLGASLGQCCGGVVHLLFEPVIGRAGWLVQAAALRRARTPFVIAVPASGDACVGRLVVTDGGTFGAADAGRDGAYASVVERAREILRAGESAQLAQVAGTDMAARWFFDPVRDDCFDVVLFGAGHVGRALVKLCADLPCRVAWVDARRDEFPVAVPPNVEVVCTDEPEAEVGAAPPGAFFLVMTHDHAQDERISEAILRRNDCAYFGLIGSLSKRRRFEQRLARRGMPVERFVTMVCPIGVPGISGKAPATIAVAVAAQLLQVHSRSSATLPDRRRDNAATASAAPAPALSKSA
ncbi:MAG: xanthine dehydrogenase accessory protein XdhC [Casimicrobiaceae bacterium]